MLYMRHATKEWWVMEVLCHLLFSRYDRSQSPPYGFISCARSIGLQMQVNGPSAVYGSDKKQELFP
jgi:hypothetical protein